MEEKNNNLTKIILEKEEEIKSVKSEKEKNYVKLGII